MWGQHQSGWPTNIVGAKSATRTFLTLTGRPIDPLIKFVWNAFRWDHESVGPISDRWQNKSEILSAETIQDQVKFQETAKSRAMLVRWIGASKSVISKKLCGV